MSQNAAKINTPPGGRRLGNAQVALRFDFVEKQLLNDASRQTIVAACMIEFSMSARTADEYTKRVRDSWGEKTREDDRADALARYDRLSQKFEKAGNYGAVVGVERLRADVSGLRHPSSKTDSSASAEPQASTVDRMDDMTLAELLHHSLAMPLTIQRAVKAGLIALDPGLCSALHDNAKQFSALASSADVACALPAGNLEQTMAGLDIAGKSSLVI